MASKRPPSASDRRPAVTAGQLVLPLRLGRAPASCRAARPGGSARSVRLRVTVPATQVLVRSRSRRTASGSRSPLRPRKGPARRTDLEVVTLSTGSTRVWAAATGILPDREPLIRGACPGRRTGGSWRSSGNRITWVECPARRGTAARPDVGRWRPAGRQPPGHHHDPPRRRSTFQEPTRERSCRRPGRVRPTTAYSGDQDDQARRPVGFAEYSTRTGKLVRILGYWRIEAGRYWSRQRAVVRARRGACSSGPLPDGRVGVINGNEFTPLNMPPRATASSGRRPSVPRPALVTIGGMTETTIGLLHPGEMGAAVGQCLVSAGHRCCGSRRAAARRPGSAPRPRGWTGAALGGDRRPFGCHRVGLPAARRAGRGPAGGRVRRPLPGRQRDLAGHRG